MGPFQTLIKLLPAAAAFFVVAWFVTFQFNPYQWCDDHPEQEKKDEYYLCEPFGFELKKGVIDRPVNDKFAGEEKVLYYKKNKNGPKKEYNCQDSETFMTQDGYDYCMKNR